MDPPTRCTATVLARSPAPHAPDAGERRTYRFEVRLHADDGAPRDAVVEQDFWPLELKPSRGDCDVVVRADADGTLRFELAGDPRFDADALIAATALRRRTHS